MKSLAILFVVFFAGLVLGFYLDDRMLARQLLVEHLRSVNNCASVQ